MVGYEVTVHRLRLFRAVAVSPPMQKALSDADRDELWERECWDAAKAKAYIAEKQEEAHQKMLQSGKPVLDGGYEGLAAKVVTDGGDANSAFCPQAATRCTSAS